MKSAIRRTPMATLGAVAPSGPAGMDDREVRPVPSGAAGVTTVVVAGVPGCGKTAVTDALLGRATPDPAPGTGAAHEGGTGPDPAATPAAVDNSAWMSYHHGDEPVAYAYVPGRRAPHPLSLDQVRAGDPAAVARGGPGRPPRRVEVLHPADVLRHVRLVDTPGVGGFDQAYVEIVLDALDDGAELLFVAEAATALQMSQLDFLAQVEQRDVAVTFVLTKIDAHPQWPAVLAANQKLVHDHAPGLATARWYAVSARCGCVSTPPAVEEAARGLAGVGVDALRRAFTEPRPGESTPPPVRPVAVDAPDAPRPPAPRVAPGATDERWTAVLEREIRSRRTAAAQRLAIDLAAVHVRCVRETTSEAGCARLASVFDRQLHALSLRATRSVENAATAIMHRVFAEILEVAPDDAALDRIRRATRRAVESADSGAPEWDRVLLVTSTSGVAATTGPGAVAGLAAVAPAAGGVLPPIGVALSAGCYTARHREGDRRRCRAWLQQTVHTLETELGREVARRFGDLREALVVVATDTLEHGVLLACPTT
ncbi:hypothetical protein ACNTMW_29505 [Planosporangium sp. 12N6]|uniref:hypothetical protein n=1 Tax=Planosporangium spinosum TaxID=3402278 RepID=UPI003CF6D62C